jgi:hypothetical protein
VTSGAARTGIVGLDVRLNIARRLARTLDRRLRRPRCYRLRAVNSAVSQVRPGCTWDE